ncbi:hypothetical protein Ciccas_005729 [Cichlidogyrus casuarinus]|uniref:Uncharacterized protein n=1 Tax=Cichlidogyrus casuarinus TaxID=1844966 RepID=A0ABD2Q8C4_9PLAT
MKGTFENKRLTCYPPAKKNRKHVGPKVVKRFSSEKNYVCSAILDPTAGAGIPLCMMFHQKEITVVMFELLFKSQLRPFFALSSS